MQQHRRIVENVMEELRLTEEDVCATRYLCVK